MVSAHVEPWQRFTRQHACPVCGGWNTLAHGRGIRCAGYVSADEQAALCTREEYAGTLPARRTAAGDTWAHALDGSCPCGVPHADGIAQNRERTGNAPRSIPQPTKVATWHTQQFPDILKGAKFAGIWTYCDASGRMRYSVLRYDLPDGGKTYPQARWRDDEKAWAWGLADTERLLYRLRELVQAPRSRPVFVVEGEKCADALRSLGLVATTCSEGAEKWCQVGASVRHEALRGRTVVILPDHDEPGSKHARMVASDLAGVAKRMHLVELPGLTDGEDVVDWIAAGHTALELLELVIATPPMERPAPVVPAPTPVVQPSTPPVDPSELRKREEALRRVNERNRELEAGNAWKRAVQANKPLAASTRMVANVVRDMLAGGKADEAGWTQLYMPTVAKRAGVGDDTAGEAVKKLAECHALQRRTVTTSDDLGRVISRVLVRPGPLWDTPAKWTPPKARNHGGARTCPECKSADVIVETVTRCTCRTCGTKWVENGSRRQKPSHSFPKGNSRQDDGHTLYTVKMTAVSKREQSA